MKNDNKNIWFLDASEPQTITYKDIHEQEIGRYNPIEIEVDDINDLSILAEQCKKFWENGLIIDFKERTIYLYNGWME